MENLLQNISQAVELGKIDKNTPYPPELKGEDGASELTLKAIKLGIEPTIILNKGLMLGMSRIGEKFSQGKAFIPNMLIAAKAMNTAVEHLKPYFSEGDIISKGTLILGTVKGDLHDIGKNLVKMIVQGNGWDIIDLGTDVDTEKFVKAVDENKGAIVGLSALLTTTMLNMQEVVKVLHNSKNETKVYIGGAPVSQSFCDNIGADGYFSDPHSFVSFLETNVKT